MYEKGASSNANETRTGNKFSELGYDLTFLKEINQTNVKTPNLWVDGIGKVDVYTPEVREIDKILTGIEKKNKQTIAVLTQIDLSGKDMQQIANRTWGKWSTNNINILFFSGLFWKNA